MAQVIQAQAIAAPLYRDLEQQPFAGRVLGVFNRACNLVDDRRRVIALTVPEIGKGPFSVTLPAGSALFQTLTAGQPARADAHAIKVGPWHILLNGAEVWEPAVDFTVSPANLPPLVAAVQAYADWPVLTENTPVARRIVEQGRKGALNLMTALQPPVDGDRLSAAVGLLAGLGQGLTPAGDDFLLGVMAALWLFGQTDLPDTIARTAIPKTGILSGAFLQAAARGQFMEPWHALISAIKRPDEAGIRAAVQWIADFGASSGVDALAGLAQTMANHT